MGWFKNKREEQECYIDKKIIAASNLSYDKLKKNIYLKKFDLRVLKEEIKTTMALLIVTVLLTSTTIFMSWVTFYTNLSDSIIKANEISNEFKGEINQDEKNAQIDSIVDMLNGSVDLGRRVILVGGIFIFIAMAYGITERILKSSKEKKIALLELELDILLEEDKRRRLVKDILEEKCIVENKITEINE